MENVNLNNQFSWLMQWPWARVYLTLISLFIFKLIIKQLASKDRPIQSDDWSLIKPTELGALVPSGDCKTNNVLFHSFKGKKNVSILVDAEVHKLRPM